MKITARQYAEELLRLTEGKTGKALDGEVKRFVAMLASRHELSKWREISRAFDNAWKRTYGASTVHLTTAHPAPAKLLQELKARYAHADISNAVDPDLIGGAILQVDDRRYDGSISGHLEMLKTNLAT